MKPMTVLVAEDDALLLGAMVRALEAHGYVVLSARSALDAIDLVRKHEGTIDLLLVDFKISDSHGLLVADVVERYQPQAKVVMISGVIAEDMLRPEDRALIDGFIAKPFTTGELLVQVRSICGKG